MTSTGGIPTVDSKPLLIGIPGTRKKKKAKALLMASLPPVSPGSRVRCLLEMAMEFGPNDPDSVHPSHKRALARGEHGMGQHPALSKQAAEKHASATYRNIIQKLRTYGGVVPSSVGQASDAAVDAFRTLAQIQQREAQHRQALQDLAVETVLSMPEFKSLRGAIERGDVRIDAKLTPRISISGIKFADEGGDELEGENTPEIAAEYQQLINRRKMANLFTHGAAVANNYSALENPRVFDAVADIDPTLMRAYGKLMSYSELGYFNQPLDVMRAAAQNAGSEQQLGANHVQAENDGSTTIVAQGISFPVLVHELVKGIMEYFSMSPDDDPETAQSIRNRSDYSDDEAVQMQIGPSIYRAFMAALGPDNQAMMPYVYNRLTHQLPEDDYQRIMKGLIDGDPQAAQWIRDQAAELREKFPQD
jgi:hypothetical protein